MSKKYILYDGRAMFDVDAATVMEFVGERGDIRSALRVWKDHDAVLVEYDEDGGTLSNERVIGHIDEGYKRLMKTIAS